MRGIIPLKQKNCRIKSKFQEVKIMQRDMELIRKILFKIEDTVDNTGKTNLQIEGYAMEQVAYHCSILYEGGYIHSCNIKYGSNEVHLFSVGRLTWEGHEFLDKIREDTIWNKTKDTISEKGLPFVFDIVKSVSSGIITGIIKNTVGV